MTHHSLHPLVKRTVAGDREAFEKLLLSQKAFIFWTIRKMTDCREDIEDISQEVAVRLYRHIASLRSPEAFGSWLRTLIHHECLRFFAKQKQCHALEALEGWENHFVETDKDCIPVSYVERHELGADLTKAFETLPESVRKIFFMRYCKDMHYRDIASAAGVKTAKVSVTLFRAKIHLRKSLCPGSVSGA